jgi:hypothetical protein
MCVYMSFVSILQVLNVDVTLKSPQILLPESLTSASV